MRRVLVTGGSRGLGLEICRHLLGAGWAVTTVARRKSAEVESLLDSEGSRFEFIEADLADPAGLRAVVEQGRLLDGVQGFVSNAALAVEGLLTLTSEAALRRCVDVNLNAPMLLAREVLKGMLGSQVPGSLVFIASVAARTGFKGLSVYSATKGGLTAFSRSVAREYGERGIRSNCVLPGFLETEMTSGLDADQRGMIERRTALKRLGAGSEVVGAVEFLLSEASGYVTGSEIVVDGGMTA